MKIILVGGQNVDLEWMRGEFPSGFEVTIQTLNDNFSQEEVSTSLVLYVHDGRSTTRVLQHTDTIEATIRLQNKIKRDLDGIIILRPGDLIARDDKVKEIQYTPQFANPNKIIKVTPVYVNDQKILETSKNSFLETLRTWLSYREAPQAQAPQPKAQQPQVPLPKTQPPQDIQPPREAPATTTDVKAVVSAVELKLTKDRLIKKCDAQLKRVIFHRARTEKLREAITNADSLDSLNILIKSQLDLFDSGQGRRKEKQFTSLSDPLRWRAKIRFGYYGMLEDCQKILSEARIEQSGLEESVNQQLNKTR